jgi:hypothetical protein
MVLNVQEVLHKTIGDKCARVDWNRSHHTYDVAFKETLDSVERILLSDTIQKS